MSKVVKGVGRAIGKVVDGVKKVAKSKIGKVLIGAALVYFGGAALMGAMGSGAAGAAGAGGLSGLSGAAANVSAAWTSLGTAGSQLLAGNLGNVASALGSGIGGSAATIGAEGAMLVNGVAQGAAAASGAMNGAGAYANAIGSTTSGAGSQAAMLAEQTAGFGQAGLQATQAATQAGSNGLISNAMSGAQKWWGGLDKTEKILAAQAGTGLASTGFKAIGAYQNNRQARDMYNRQRSDYNTNIGTRIWE